MEGRRGRRMVREAVQDERRLTIGITTLQRVKGAVWQVEGDVFELHVCQPFPRAVGHWKDRVIRRSIGWYWLGVAVESLLDVDGDQIVVERDGGGGPGGRGVDQLRGVVHDVAGRPHAVDAGATGAIGGDPALVIDFAAQ